MKHFLPVSALLACTLLAACSAGPQRQAAGTPDDGRCNAEAVQRLVDKRINSDLAEQARIDSGAQFLRVIQPNQPVTLDYNSQRLNIDIDEDDMIIRLNCG